MSTRLTADSIFSLLPAIYRIRDHEQEGALEALVETIAEQMRGMEIDIERLYDNAFIETCQEWVTPYIGDLAGVRGLHPGKEGVFSQRAYVANTLRYRRRKGTAPMLEQLARDITGWPARVVEMFQLLETTQYLNHTRLFNHRTPDLRKVNQLELIDTPFDTAAHTADVRSITTGRGKHNIPNVGIFLWRLQSFGLRRAAVAPAAGEDPGYFFLSPLQVNVPLFNQAQTETEITHLAEEINVPDRVRRRPLHDELNSRRQSLADNGTLQAVYFTSAAPLFSVYLDGALEPVPSEQIVICNLSSWRRPPSSVTITKSDGSTEVMPIRAGLDPALGRLAFSETEEAAAFHMSYRYGFSADLGGGPYNRTDSAASFVPENPLAVIGVSKRLISSSPDYEIVETLTEALNRWHAPETGPEYVIVLLDSDTYEEDITINVSEGNRLLIVSGTCPEEVAGSLQGTVSQWSAEIHRPHLKGNIEITGTADPESENPGSLIINGLLIEGDVRVEEGNLGELTLDHLTVVPNRGEVVIGPDNHLLNVSLDRSIGGRIVISENIAGLCIQDSILEDADEPVIEAPETEVRLESSTLFGQVSVSIIHASDCLFNDVLTAARKQEGCLRYSYLPPESETPRQYRCQPNLAIEDAGKEAAQELSETEKEALRSLIKPRFTASEYINSSGLQPGFAQLHACTPVEIREGASDGSEMGAFSHLQQPQRETNLRVSLDEYLRAGLEAGLFFAT